MPGRAKAVKAGARLADRVVEVARELGLDCHVQVPVGRRIWGAQRKIDVVLVHPSTRRTLGIECKYQAGGGSAEEKVPSTIQDIAAWPIPGIVVFEGEGFTENMRSFLISTGKAVELCDLAQWLRLYFGLDLEGAVQGSLEVR